MPPPRPVKPSGKKTNGGKLVWPAGTMLAPVPATLVSCCAPDGSGANLLTVAWAGTVNSTPPMVAIGIQPIRHSHDLIRETGEFVVNLASADIAKPLDLCGVISGRDGDKWSRAGLTPEPAERVRPPLVAECPVALECKVVSAQPLGSHTMFLGEVLAVRVSPALVDEKGQLDLKRADLVAFAHGRYYAVGRRLGFFGWSVRKRKAARRS